MRKHLLLILLYSFKVSLSFSQQIIINGEAGRHDLVWSDFTGNPDKSSPFYASTYWNVNYRYKGVTFIGDIAILKDFITELKLEPVKSWSKKEFQEPGLLQHEQGHFNFGRLCMLEFLQKVNETKFSRNAFRETIDSAFTSILNKYKDMELKYDEETDHFKNKRKQVEWNTFFIKELKRFGE